MVLLFANHALFCNKAISAPYRQRHIYKLKCYKTVTKHLYKLLLSFKRVRRAFTNVSQFFICCSPVPSQVRLYFFQESQPGARYRNKTKLVLFIFYVLHLRCTKPSNAMEMPFIFFFYVLKCLQKIEQSIERGKQALLLKKIGQELAQ